MSIVQGPLDEGNFPGLRFPREISRGVFWLCSCLEADYKGQMVHSHLSTYLIKGEAFCLLVDTGHPKDWAGIEKQLEEALDEDTLDYIFPTHPEIPHAGNLLHLLAKYPQATVVGDLRAYPVYFPEHVNRFQMKGVGDRIDLGGTTVTFLDAPIKDLTNTLWAYESGNQILFASDGLSFSHHHVATDCCLTSEEIATPPGADEVGFFNERAFFWAKYVNPEPFFKELDVMLERYPNRMIAGAHGNVITNPHTIVPLLREAMIEHWRRKS